MMNIINCLGYGWWFNTKDHTFKATEPSSLSVGFEDSVALIEKTFNDLGPFDGILGFSQGAAFASILCAMQQKKCIVIITYITVFLDPRFHSLSLTVTPIKFDFAIIISGFKSLCEPHAYLYNEQLSLNTLHVYGETDKIIPTGKIKMSKIFVTNSTSYFCISTFTI